MPPGSPKKKDTQQVSEENHVMMSNKSDVGMGVLAGFVTAAFIVAFLLFGLWITSDQEKNAQGAAKPTSIRVK